MIYRFYSNAEVFPYEIMQGPEVRKKAYKNRYSKDLFFYYLLFVALTEKESKDDNEMYSVKNVYKVIKVMLEKGIGVQKSLRLAERLKDIEDIQ